MPIDIDRVRAAADIILSELQTEVRPVAIRLSGTENDSAVNEASFEMLSRIAQRIFGEIMNDSVELNPALEDIQIDTYQQLAQVCIMHGLITFPFFEARYFKAVRDHITEQTSGKRS